MRPLCNLPYFFHYHVGPVVVMDTLTIVTCAKVARGYARYYILAIMTHSVKCRISCLGTFPSLPVKKSGDNDAYRVQEPPNHRPLWRGSHAHRTEEGQSHKNDYTCFDFIFSSSCAVFIFLSPYVFHFFPDKNYCSLPAAGNGRDIDVFSKIRNTHTSLSHFIGYPKPGLFVWIQGGWLRWHSGMNYNYSWVPFSTERITTTGRLMATMAACCTTQHTIHSLKQYAMSL